MLERKKSLRALLVVGAVGVAVASCSSGGGGGGRTGSATPANLVSTCDMICGNVVAQCAPATGLYGACISACGNLNLLPATCLDPFLSYLTCIAGATSVQCGADGQYVLITPQQCRSDREATLTCNASPGLIAACVALPGNDSCGSAGRAVSGNPVFCVGAPEGCVAPHANPLGIGVYCCP